MELLLWSVANDFHFLSRVKFKDPQYPDGFVFKAVLLPGAKWGFFFLFAFISWIPGWTLKTLFISGAEIVFSFALVIPKEYSSYIHIFFLL